MIDPDPAAPVGVRYTNKNMIAQEESSPTICDISVSRNFKAPAFSSAIAAHMV